MKLMSNTQTRIDSCQKHKIEGGTIHVFQRNQLQKCHALIFVLSFFGGYIAGVSTNKYVTFTLSTQ